MNSNAFIDADTLKNLKHLLPLIYIIPTYLLYFCILYVMFLGPAKTKFSGSFYCLFGFSALNCIIQSIFYYAILRFTMTPAFFSFTKDCTRRSWIYPTMYSLMYYSASAQHFYSLFISFNRFTVFILLAKYKTFWKQYLVYFLGFSILAPILFIWHFPFVSVECFFIPGAGAIIFPINYIAIPWMDNSRNLFILILITSFLSLALNMYVIFQLFNRKFAITNTKITSHDKKMFIYSLLIFFIEICGCVQQSLLTFGYTIFIDAVASTQWILADVGTLAPAWFILATNKQLRQEVINLFDFGGNIVHNLPVVVVTSSMQHTRQ